MSIFTWPNAFQLTCIEPMPVLPSLFGGLVIFTGILFICSWIYWLLLSFGDSLSPFATSSRAQGYSSLYIQEWLLEITQSFVCGAGDFNWDQQDARWMAWHFTISLTLLVIINNAVINICGQLSVHLSNVLCVVWRVKLLGPRVFNHLNLSNHVPKHLYCFIFLPALYGSFSFFTFSAIIFFLDSLDPVTLLSVKCWFCSNPHYSFVFLYT